MQGLSIFSSSDMITNVWVIECCWLNKSFGDTLDAWLQQRGSCVSVYMAFAFDNYQQI